MEEPFKIKKKFEDKESLQKIRQHVKERLFSSNKNSIDLEIYDFDGQGEKFDFIFLKAQPLEEPEKYFFIKYENRVIIYVELGKVDPKIGKYSFPAYEIYDQQDLQGTGIIMPYLMKDVDKGGMQFFKKFLNYVIEQKQKQETFNFKPEYICFESGDTGGGKLHQIYINALTDIFGKDKINKLGLKLEPGKLGFIKIPLD